MPDANDATRASALDSPVPDRLKRWLPAGWVWHATLETRAAGQRSVLAVGEMVFAVALYWGIAWYFETHLHLLTSVFIAPLLLLRSPESIQTGVSWFLKDWFGLTSYGDWPERRKAFWVGAMTLGSAVPTYFLAQWLSQRWLPGLTGWSLFGGSAAIAAVSVVVPVAFVGAGAGANAFGLGGMFSGVAVVAGAGGSVSGFTGALAGALAGVGASALAAAVAIAGAGSDSSAAVLGCAACLLNLVFGPGIVAGLALRGLGFRVAATLRFLSPGVRRLPQNWHENNFLTDAFVPAELLPGIREKIPTMALDGLRREFTGERRKSRLVLYSITGLLYFLPAFLYRLNIKATAWFWWPLAYLLRLAPVLPAAGQQREALCAPWTDPFERVKLGGSVLFTGASLVLPHLDLSTLWGLRHLQALPLAAKVTLAVDWAHYAPWHWAQLVIAVSGLGMFWLAGRAVSNARNDNWDHYYRESGPKAVRRMTWFRRLRVLAVVALVVMGLGALLVEFQSQWTPHVPVPSEWLAALAEFYAHAR